MRRQSPYNTCSSQHSSQSIWYQAGSHGSHLRPSAWTLLPSIFCTVLPRTTFWQPWFHGGHRMLQANPWGNIWVPTRHQCLGKEDIAGNTLYLFMYVWRRDSNHNIKIDERTSSSFSGVTFLHYKAAASHSMLLAMHAAYLSGCALKGSPLHAGRLGSLCYWRR